MNVPTWAGACILAGALLLALAAFTLAMTNLQAAGVQ
jgi:hypothetical protein